MDHLFVYGTLQRAGSHHGLVGPVHAAWPARTRGRLVALPQGYPALVDVEDGWVFGEVLELPPPLPWARLDPYEDCDPSRPETSLYHRVRRPVQLPGERWIEAWCYVMPPDRAPLEPGRGARILPGGRWPG